MGYDIRMWSAVCSEVPIHDLVKEQDPICAWRMESPNTSPQVVKPNASCLGQAHLNRSGTCPGYKNTKLGSILTILSIPFMICPLRSMDAKFGKVV